MCQGVKSQFCIKKKIYIKKSYAKPMVQKLRKLNICLTTPIYYPLHINNPP